MELKEVEVQYRGEFYLRVEVPSRWSIDQQVQNAIAQFERNRQGIAVFGNLHPDYFEVFDAKTERRLEE